MMNQRVKVDDIRKSLSIAILSSEDIYTRGKNNSYLDLKTFYALGLLWFSFVLYLAFLMGEY